MSKGKRMFTLLINGVEEPGWSLVSETRDIRVFKKGCEECVVMVTPYSKVERFLDRVFLGAPLPQECSILSASPSVLRRFDCHAKIIEQQAR